MNYKVWLPIRLFFAIIFKIKFGKLINTINQIISSINESWDYSLSLFLTAQRMEVCSSKGFTVYTKFQKKNKSMNCN